MGVDGAPLRRRQHDQRDGEPLGELDADLQRRQGPGLDGPRSMLNGNYVTKEAHALSDPWRYRFMPKAWKKLHAMPNVLAQQWARIPKLLKGLVAGAGYGGASRGVNDPC